jgi:hypothetical protein
VVRRRRTAATAVAAAFAVVGGVAGVATFQAPREPEAADSTVVGVAVPEEVAIHGFPYEFAEDATLDGGNALQLGSSEEARAVSLVANGLGPGSATLYLDDTAVARAFDGERVAVPVPVPDSDVAPEVRVELHDAPSSARAGVAIYEATGELAPGASNGDVVFRETIAGARLIAASFSAEGEAKAIVSFEAPESNITFMGFCRTEEADLWYLIGTVGGYSTSECGGAPNPDAVASIRTHIWAEGPGPSTSYTPGSTYEVKAAVTRGNTFEAVEDADAQLGVAVYGGGDTVSIGGTDVDILVEHQGRTWRLDEELSRGDRDQLRLTADTDLLLGFIGGRGDQQVIWDGGLTNGDLRIKNRSWTPELVHPEALLLRGDTYDVKLVSDNGPVRSSLLVYRPE